MLIWLNGTQNTKWSPNENYAREVMELFTLGAGRGYTEDDVREQARALTGWRNDWEEGEGDVNFRYDPNRHDTGQKTVFGKKGNYDWQDACRLCIQNPQARVVLRHASSGATSSRRRRRRRPSRSSRRSTRRTATRCGRSWPRS